MEGKGEGWKKSRGRGNQTECPQGFFGDEAEKATENIYNKVQTRAEMEAPVLETDALSACCLAR